MDEKPENPGDLKFVYAIIFIKNQFYCLKILSTTFHMIRFHFLLRNERMMLMRLLSLGDIFLVFELLTAELCCF
jgi:hypothetical protein